MVESKGKPYHYFNSYITINSYFLNAALFENVKAHQASFSSQTQQRQDLQSCSAGTHQAEARVHRVPHG